MIYHAAMIVLIWALCGGVVTRLHGSETKLPRWVIQFFYSSIWIIPHIKFIISSASFFAAFGAISLGHGRQQNLKEPLSGNREWVEIPFLFLSKIIPSYWYKVIILMINGILLVSGGIIQMSYLHDYMDASIVAFGGSLTAVGYMVGWHFYPKETGNNFLGFTQATQIGEFLSGFFAVGFYAIANVLNLCQI